MTKLKQFSNKFDVLYSRENNPRTGEHRASPAVEPSPQEIWGKRELVLPGGRRGNKETRQDWQGDQGLP